MKEKSRNTAQRVDLYRMGASKRRRLPFRLREPFKKHPASPHEALQDLNSPQVFTEVKDIPAFLGLQRLSVIRGGGFVRDHGPACTSDRKYSPFSLL